MRHNIFLLLFLAFCVVDSQAQNERIQRLRKAQTLYEGKQYLESAAEYEALMLSTASAAIMGADAKANLAHCYVELGRPEKAEPLYREVMPDMVGRPETHLHFGEALMLNGKIEEAKQQLLVYAEKRPDDPRGSALKDRCTMIENIRPVFPNVNVHPQTIVNRKGTDEFASGYCGNALVFASDRVPKGSVAEWTDQKRGYLDLYIAPINADGQLEAPKKFPYPINSPSRHDGPASFSRDGKTMFYSQSTRASASAEQLSLQILVVKYENDRWSSPEVLPFIEPAHLFSHPCLSPDGNHLYFMSSRPGGQGGTDIWVSDLRDGRWMPPRNLGPKVNTNQNEGYPYMHADGTLYFASKGHANFGGYDIFRVRPLGNGVDWLDAENLGRPFNSAKDDTYFLLSDSGFSGFVASKRDGDDNIYQFDVISADSLKIPADLQPLSAPDFLGLEVVSEESVAAADLNPDETMSEWRVPDPKQGKEDESFVDKMLAGGSTLPATDNLGNNTTNNNTETTKTTDHTGGSSGNKSENGGNKTTNFSDVFTNNTGNTGGNKNNNSSNLPPEKNPTLIVNLKVIDANINVALQQAKVTVVNKYTQEKKEYNVQNDGSLELRLNPDQKYIVRAACDGYYGGELPIVTEKAYQSETKRAFLPLVKKS